MFVFPQLSARGSIMSDVALLAPEEGRAKDPYVEGNLKLLDVVWVSDWLSDWRCRVNMQGPVSIYRIEV